MHEFIPGVLIVARPSFQIVALHTADILAGIRRSRVLGPECKAAADADVVLRLLGSIAGDSLAALRARALSGPGK